VAPDEEAPVIRIAHRRNWLLGEIEREEVPWGIGCTARELAPAWTRASANQIGCSRNGREMTDAEWDELLADGDSLFYFGRPGVEVTVSAALFEFLVTAAPIINAIGAAIFSAVVSRLLLPSKKPTKPGDNDSATYAFENLSQNTRIEGSPIPFVVGRHRQAPPIINQFVRTSLDANGNPVSELLTLMLISEGPIHSIGGVTEDADFLESLPTLQINNQPSENFDDLVVHVRLGSLEQTPIPDFAEPVSVANIGQTLRFPTTLISAVGDNASDPVGGTNTPAAGTAIAAPGSVADSNINVTKWPASHVVSYTSGIDADEFVLLFTLPQGLGNFSGADPAPNTVVVQVRYQQVDSLGVAFGNVIILDALRVTLSRLGSFSFEYRQRFFNPTGYLPPTHGFFARSRALNQGNPGLSYTIDPSPIPQRPPNQTRFSFATWIRRRNAQAIGTTNRIFQWFDLPNLEGFGLNLERLTSTQSRLQFQWGTGALINSPAEAHTRWGPLSTDTTNFHHLVVTYDGGYDTVNGLVRTRFYLDGVLSFTDIRAGYALWDMAQQIRLMSDSEGSPTLGFDGHMDETTFWSKTLSSYEVSRLYAGGAPIGTPDDEDGLVIGAGMNNYDSTGLDHTDAFGPGLNGAASPAGWKLGTGADAASDPDISVRPTTVLGVVKDVTLTPNNPLKGKFRIDVLRINAEDDTVGLVSEIQLGTVQQREFQEQSFPGLALLATKLRATDQLQGDPLQTVIPEGFLCPVWDGVDPVFPNMVDTYTRNPAWIAVAILTNPTFGLGNLYAYTDLDVAAFKSLADYCDALIYDNDSRQALINARQIESADTATDPNMSIVAEDCVRYRFDRLPLNFPQPTGGKDSTGKYITLKATGTPSPSVPAWLTTQLNAGAQEVVYVAYDTATGDFYVYCKSSAAVGASSALYTPAVSGTDFLEGEMHAERYRYDGVFDRADVPALEAVTQVLQVARAALVKYGSRVSVFVDKPASPVALIGMGNIIEGSLRGNIQGIRNRANAEEGEFYDENLNFEKKYVQDELPDVTDPTKQSSFSFRRVRLEGIVRRGQAKRHLRRDLNTLNLIRRMKQVELGIDALPIHPGDVVAASHDVPGYGISGRVIETSGSGASIKLDRAVTIEMGKSYQVQVENAASGVRQTKPITTGAGTYPAGTALTVGGGGLTLAPEENDKYAFGEVGKEVKEFRVVESTLNPQTLRRTLKMLEYDPQVYEDDFGTFETKTITNLPAPSVPQIPPGVENLTVNEETVRGPDGSIRILAHVSFSHVAETYHGVSGADVFVSRGAPEHGESASGFGRAQLVARLDARTTATRVDYPFERDATYTVWVVPRSRVGSTDRTYVSFQTFTPSGLARHPLPPRNIRVAIAGDHALHEWDDDEDGAQDHGAIVEVRQGGWILGVPVAVSPAQARRSLPVAAWANAPTNAVGAGMPELVARTKLRTGQYSDAVHYSGTLAVASDDGAAFQGSEEDTGWT
jgi:hypothetical protein